MLIDTEKLLAEVQQKLSYNPETGEFTVKPFRWAHNVGKVLQPNKSGYVHFNSTQGTIGMHRIVWLIETGKWPEHEINHKDGNRANNRIANLEDVTHAENLQGYWSVTPKNSSTGERNISYRKSRKDFFVSATRNGVLLYIGAYPTLELAIKARDDFFATGILPIKQSRHQEPPKEFGKLEVKPTPAERASYK